MGATPLKTTECYTLYRTDPPLFNKLSNAISDQHCKCSIFHSFSHEVTCVELCLGLACVCLSARSLPTHTRTKTSNHCNLYPFNSKSDSFYVRMNEQQRARDGINEIDWTREKLSQNKGLVLFCLGLGQKQRGRFSKAQKAVRRPIPLIFHGSRMSNCPSCLWKSPPAMQLDKNSMG